MQALTSRSSNRRRFMRLAGAGATTLLAATAVASTAGAATTPANRPIGASGSVAALSASSMEVQNTSSGQTTVNWSTATTFSKTVTEAVSALAAGDCVTVTGTPSKQSKTTIAARSITVSSSGSCTLGGRTGTAAGAGGGGGFPGGGFRRAGGTGASGGGGAEGGTPQRFSGGSGFRNGLADLAIASGKVTGVSGSTVTVSGISITPGSFARGATNSSSKAKKPTAPKTKTETLKITTSSTTTVSATQTAASTDLAVGDCVSAFGPAASNGSVTASTVRITATSGTCSSGFGAFGGGPGGFGGPGPGGPGGPGGGGTGA